MDVSYVVNALSLPVGAAVLIMSYRLTRTSSRMTVHILEKFADFPEAKLEL